VVVALALIATAAGAAADSADALFDDSREHELWMTVDPSNWAQLKQDYLLNTYYPAQLRIEGQELARIGIRSRGSGSRSPDKPNLLLSFDKYQKNQTLLGLSSVTLKANNQDPSLLREVLAMKLLRAMGVPAPREAPARLYVNGEYFGAYMLVEKIDSAFLAGNFGENQGFLYEWEAMRTPEGYRFEYLGSDPALYSPIMWSPSNHESDPDPMPLVELVDFINNSSDEDFRNHLAEYLDLDNLLNYIAMENFVADYDGILGTVFGMNNFYFYRFEGSRLSTFIAWDKDGSFDWEYKPIYEGVFENVLTRRMMNVPEWQAQYVNGLLRAATVAGGRGGWLDQEFLRLYELVRNSASEDPHKQCTIDGVMVSCGPAEFESAADRLRQFISLRADFVVSQVRYTGSARN
jgi:spore coat protein CotH